MRKSITKGQGSWFDPTFFTQSSDWYPERRNRETPKGTEKHHGYSSDVYTDQALNWLRNRDSKRPFCLMLHFKAPHHSYEYPKRYHQLLEDVMIDEPFNLHENIQKTSPLLKARHVWHMTGMRGYFGRHQDDKYPPRSKASAAWQHLIHKYIRCVAAVDENVKRVIDHLESEGIKEETLIIYTSDQGYWLGQHGLYDKRLILEESMKMPLIVRFPKEIKAGTVTNALSSNVDMAPTLLDYAGIQPPESMQGKSLRPLFKGAAGDKKRKGICYAYWSGGHPHWGVRTDRYKLVHFPGTKEYEFYDLQEDPFEMKNLAGDRKYQSAIKATEEILKKLSSEVDIKPSEMPGAKK